MPDHPDYSNFVALSAALTSYEEASLWATGCLELYHRQLADVAGPDLLARFEAPAGHSDGEEGHQPCGSLLNDPDLGPLARSLIQLCYLGQWTPMPPDWVQRNGSRSTDTPRILSSLAYREDLIWTTIDAHPMGAKPPGFGSWATEPAPDDHE